MDIVGVESKLQPPPSSPPLAAAEPQTYRPCLYCGGPARPGSFWCCSECEADWELAITPSWAR